MAVRSPFDGSPYYCKLCGKGWAEYNACEETDCELESETTARSRQKRPQANLKHKRVADFEIGDKVLMHDNSVRIVKALNHGKGLIIKNGNEMERPILIEWAEGGFTMESRLTEAQVLED